MHLVITLSEEALHPRVLFIAADQALALAHAANFCGDNDLLFDPKRISAKKDTGVRNFQYYWDWPQDVSHIWASHPNKWVWRHSGRELSRIEFLAGIPYQDVNYLMGRLRAARLTKEHNQK